MSIFNSLGSNYNLKFVLKTLISINDENYQEELKQVLGKRYAGKATLLYKGREAIELALKSLDLPLGSFVAINGFTCLAVYETVKKVGLNVEYLDIEKGELNFSSKELEEHLEKNSQTKVVIVQNTLGYPCQIERIAKICQDYHLTLIEDLAHCVGTRYENGQEAGIAGDIVVLSFSQDKIIDTVSGGAVIQRQAETESKSNGHPRGVHWKKQIIDKLYPLFTYIIRTTYSVGLGKVLHFLLKNFHLLSGPMDQLDNQLHQLPAWYCGLVTIAFANLQTDLNHRQKIASIYAELINPKIISPKISAAISLSSNLRFPIFVNNRNSLIKFLNDHQVYISEIWYDAPIAPKKYLTQTDYYHQCPNAELAAEEILNLPTHKNVSEKDAQNIALLINQWLKQ